MSYTNGLDNPADYFNTIIYTGDDSQDVTGVGFPLDLVWVKASGKTDNHQLHDSVRGATAGALFSNMNIAETSYEFDSFDSDGFTTDSGNITGINGDTHTQVAWCWKMANGTASNSNGTNITSTVSANTTAGQSIVSYSGSGTTSDTVGHGLSSLDFLIVKSRDETDSWFVKHKDLASSKNLNLNQTVAETDVTSAYSEGGLSNLSGNTFGFLDGTSDANAVNESSEAHIAYCFKGVQGYSKFSNFVGNGSSDGSTIWCGFSPAWVMIKQSSKAGEGWHIFDNKREGYNVDNDPLVANSSNAEGTSDMIDLLSNGFKLRTDSEAVNEGGETYIYIAFAEAPFVNSSGVPCNAR